LLAVTHSHGFIEATQATPYADIKIASGVEM